MESLSASAKVSRDLTNNSAIPSERLSLIAREGVGKPKFFLMDESTSFTLYGDTKTSLPQGTHSNILPSVSTFTVGNLLEKLSVLIHTLSSKSFYILNFNSTLIINRIKSPLLLGKV